MTGGLVLIDGPTIGNAGGDNSLDYELSATITGGTILGMGSSSMAETFTGGSQPFVLASVSGNAGSTVAVADTSGKVLAAYSVDKNFTSVIFSAPGLSEGETVNIVVGGTISGGDDYGIGGTVSGGNATQVTVSTTSKNTGMGGGMGGRGGF
ncbi:MAG: hypothetical protein LUB61_06940, partial [Eggerthellaceae bacterium]|nr:hypothetical protein [Eggerthellaceae bacterium]